MAQEKFACDGCGQEFKTRDELQKHRQECAALQASSGQKTRGAGGQQTRG
jgi:hypothetical protein